MSGSAQTPVLILGGRSDIGLAIAHRFARAGHAIVLAARNASTLEPHRSDISLRHDVEVDLAEFDVLNTAAMQAFVDQFSTTPAVVISVVGAMGDQRENETDVQAAAQVMRANYEGPALILSLFAERMAAEKRGTIVGISSVAGDRGRAVNYVYGSAKAGFTAFLSGLRNRLASQGVHVVTIKPGFVATQMTAGMDLPKPLTAEPSEVGEATYRAVRDKRNVVYTRSIWWLVMRVITAIPEGIFKKMSI